MGRKRSIVVVPGARGEASAGGEGDDGALAAIDPRERGEWWWRQPKWSRREWVLEAGGRAVAILKGESLFSRTAHVRFADEAFEVHRGWTGNSELRQEGNPEPRLRFVARWNGGGRLEFPGGDTLELASVGFWKPSLELRTGDGHALARFRSHDSLTRHEVQVELEDPARQRGDLSGLLALTAALAFAPKRHSH